MLIGLLEAEILPPKVVAEFGSYGKMFETLLLSSRPDWSFRYYATENGELPRSMNECDAYIITGSRHSAFDNLAWINDLKNWISEANQKEKKCLGICFGHQVIAAALGGKVERSVKGWGIGASTFKVYDRPRWMVESIEPGDALTMLVSHQDQVTACPPAAKLWISNDFCPVGGFYVGQHLFSLQGHPEFRPDYLKRLVNKRKAVLGDKVAVNALISIEKYIDPGIFSELLCQFLQQKTKYSKEMI